MPTDAIKGRLSLCPITYDHTHYRLLRELWALFVHMWGTLRGFFVSFPCFGTDPNPHFPFFLIFGAGRVRVYGLRPRNGADMAAGFPGYRYLNDGGGRRFLGGFPCPVCPASPTNSM